MIQQEPGAVPLTEAESSDIFRADPDGHIEMGAGRGAVAYRRVGNGPDVVFSHGWPVSSATFRRLLPILAPHVTCHLLDYVGAGSSRFDAATEVSIAGHISALRRTVDHLGLTDFAVVGHDSGGLIARHAVAGDPRVRAMGLVNTEPASGVSWRFKLFLANRNIPGFAGMLGWLVSRRRLRANRFVLGDAFVDRELLNGEFDEFFLEPLHREQARQVTAIRILRSFDTGYLDELAGLHSRVEVPTRLVWGTADPFFPVGNARADVETFPDASLVEVDDAGLFVHEERPEEVAGALLEVIAQ